MPAVTSQSVALDGTQTKTKALYDVFRSGEHLNAPVMSLVLIKHGRQQGFKSTDLKGCVRVLQGFSPVLQVFL